MHQALFSQVVSSTPHLCGVVCCSVVVPGPSSLANTPCNLLSHHHTLMYSHPISSSYPPYPSQPLSSIHSPSHSPLPFASPYSHSHSPLPLTPPTHPTHSSLLQGGGGRTVSHHQSQEALLGLVQGGDEDEEKEGEVPDVDELYQWTQGLSFEDFDNSSRATHDKLLELDSPQLSH